MRAREGRGLALRRAARVGRTPRHSALHAMSSESRGVWAPRATHLAVPTMRTDARRGAWAQAGPLCSAGARSALGAREELWSGMGARGEVRRVSEPRARVRATLGHGAGSPGRELERLRVANASLVVTRNYLVLRLS